MLKNAFCASERSLNRWVCSVVARQQNTINLKFRQETFVVVRVDLGQCVANRCGGQVPPFVRRFTKPRPQFTTNRFNIWRSRCCANEGSHNPMVALRMWMKVRGEVNVKNVITGLTPFLIQQQSAL